MDRLNFFTKKIMKKINKNNFKKTLSAFATGITVVATKYNSILYGKTINSFSSLSLSPPLILFSLDNQSSKLNIFKKSDTITINILSNKQQLVSNNLQLKLIIDIIDTNTQGQSKFVLLHSFHILNSLDK